MFCRSGMMLIAGVMLLSQLPAQAQVCTPLQVVGANRSQVEKKVSVPGAGPIARNNWNTDFAIPSGRAYSSYVATIAPRNGGDYSVAMNLKYANDSVDKVFDEKINLKEGQPFRIKGSPRINSRPYQINLSVGGVEVVGNSYILTVAGCQ